MIAKRTPDAVGLPTPGAPVGSHLTTHLSHHRLYVSGSAASVSDKAAPMRGFFEGEQVMAKRITKAHKLFATHPGHANHMCELVAKRRMNQVATLAKGARYICHICGRAAANAKNLCEPVEI